MNSADYSTTSRKDLTPAVPPPPPHTAPLLTASPPYSSSVDRLPLNTAAVFQVPRKYFLVGYDSLYRCFLASPESGGIRGSTLYCLETSPWNKSDHTRSVYTSDIYLFELESCHQGVQAKPHSQILGENLPGLVWFGFGFLDL